MYVRFGDFHVNAEIGTEIVVSTKEEKVCRGFKVYKLEMFVNMIFMGWKMT